MLSWSVAVPAFRLQSIGDLNASNWTTVPHFYESNLFRAFATIAAPAQFYRLIKACDTNARITTAGCAGGGVKCPLPNMRQRASFSLP